MTDNEMNKKQALKEQEAYFLQLVEEKQLELIWHPDRREKCEITFTYEHSAMAVYVYREDCPMVAFQEYAMYLLFIMYANCLANGLKDWKPAAAKAVNYLRKLPDDIRDSSLDFAYTRIAEWYEASGDPKAEWHRKQADRYRLCSEDMNPWDAVREMDTMEDEKLFDFCLYVLCHIVGQGCFGEDAFYGDWQRDQYELVEEVLDKAVKHFANNEENTVLNRSFFYFLKGVYLKRTRRFKLAEAVWEIYSTLPRIKEEASFTLSLIHALWGECCLHRRDEARAREHFLKVREDEEPWVWKYVQALMAKQNASADDLNQSLLQIVTDACCQHNVTPQPLKESIDAFFAPPEMEDDEEEEDEEEQDEEVDEEDNEGEECTYTFDDWYAGAEGGDSLAQLLVGHLYYMGKYVTRNYRLAREWFYLSALQGNAVAQMNLAYIYAHGYGTEVDEPEAAKWRQKAEISQGEEMQEYGNLILTDE